MNRIKEARKNAGIKQTDLCARLGISQSALSGWENGKYEPGIAGWLSLSDALDVSVDYLMGNARVEPIRIYELSDNDRSLIQKFHALDDMAQARILNALEFEYQSIPQENVRSSNSPA